MGKREHKAVMNCEDFWENTEEKLSVRNLPLIPSKREEYSGTTSFPHLKVLVIESFSNTYIDSFVTESNYL